MSSTSRIDIRLTEEEKQKAIKQSIKLFGKEDISGYLRLIINLDASTNIIQKLKDSN